MGDLKEWLKNRDKSPKSVKELSQIFKNIPYKTVCGWVYQDKIPKNPEVREKLYNLTGIKKYKPNQNRVLDNEFNLKTEKIKIVLEEMESLIDELTFKFLLLKNTDELKPYIRSDSKNKKIYLVNLRTEMYKFLKDLIYLLKNDELRKRFIESVDKRDIAFLSSLLEALLDDKKLQIWKIFQKININKE